MQQCWSLFIGGHLIIAVVVVDNDVVDVVEVGVDVVEVVVSQE